MSERVEPVIDRSAIDTDRYEHHGGFPKVVEAEPGPNFGAFVEAMRTLQDLTVSVDCTDEEYGRALAQAQQLIDLLEPHRAPELQGPAGRVTALPGRGSLLMPPWEVVAAGPGGVRMRGRFRRYHLGGNSAVHGGVLPLLFDDLFGSLVHYAGRPISRTAYLHVNYRKVTPLDTPLLVEGTVDRTDGRKAFVSARLTDESETLLADCEGLMVQLLPWQP
ncbi:acyl-coenzyme A thioesterase PaaI-like protein [Nocardia transvalensis]|uniref:Acyl-coenzyme A thioesterase THEM4 n=1 Tax=Nocardia transvalensis TaxID=37333 RepID=A0A7W9PED9_9NOCA|nr:PaaI family thioesterase [Nocardia transvalensis]MBB5914451.1 acyl-coenzyme A thioesterase PaaI-like protein [Nocardia transvalensis]